MLTFKAKFHQSMNGLSHHCNYLKVIFMNNNVQSIISSRVNQYKVAIWWVLLRWMLALTLRFQSPRTFEVLWTPGSTISDNASHQSLILPKGKWELRQRRQAIETLEAIRLMFLIFIAVFNFHQTDQVLQMWVNVIIFLITFKLFFSFVLIAYLIQCHVEPWFCF